MPSQGERRRGRSGYFPFRGTTMKTIHPIDLEVKMEANLKMNETPPERLSTSCSCDVWGHPYPAELKAKDDKCNGNCQGCASSAIGTDVALRVPESQRA